jgi:hypothetical protein
MLACREAGYRLDEWEDLPPTEKWKAKYYYQSKVILQKREMPKKDPPKNKIILP